jgi:hypothetical protein
MRTRLVRTGLVAISLTLAAAFLVTSGPAGNAVTTVGSVIKPTIYVSGLNNPNRISFDQNGNLYIAEAGTGGHRRTFPRQCQQVPPPLGPVSGGYTGRISEAPPGGGRFKVLISHLPSAMLSPLPPYANVVLGMADIQRLHGRLIGLMGGTGCAHGLKNAVNEIFTLRRNGTIRQLANLSAFAKTHPSVNPPETDLEPDGLWIQMAEVGRDIYVNDANHQILTRVLPDGKVQEVIDFSAFYGPHTAKGYVGPTGMVYHDGFLYIGALMGTPIRPGTAMIWRVNPRSRSFTVVARDLTNVMDLTFGHDGTMYVLENSTAFGVPRKGTGKIIAIKGRDRTTIATGLDLPMGITLGPGNALYVADRGYGYRPGRGRILRFQLPAS